MTARAERLLTLVREKFARDCELDSLIKRYQNRVRELQEKGRSTGVWDIADLDQAYAEYWAEWDRRQKLELKCVVELTLLREDTPPDELTPEQHREIEELLAAGLAMARRHKEEALKAAEQAQRWHEGGPMA